jgi:hypothetical protein
MTLRMELIGKPEGGRRHGGAEGRCAFMDGMKRQHGESGSRRETCWGRLLIFFFLRFGVRVEEDIC